MGAVLNATTLPWYLIGLLTSGLLAVFYAMLRGRIVPRSVVTEMQADLRIAAEKDREVAVSMVATMQGLQMEMARNQEKILGELQARLGRNGP